MVHVSRRSYRHFLSGQMEVKCALIVHIQKSPLYTSKLIASILHHQVQRVTNRNPTPNNKYIYSSSLRTKKLSIKTIF